MIFRPNLHFRPLFTTVGIIGHAQSVMVGAECQLPPLGR